MNAPEMRGNALSTTEKPCEECGSPFAASRRWQRFCKPGCRNEWHRKRQIGPDGRIAELERRVAALEAKEKAPA